jgi:excinuclease ABC subunit A
MKCSGRSANRPPVRSRAITIRGAREHNLKNIDSRFPRDKLVVFTGLSGSGKSSLAFDTIYAEGQRRYVESLSAYARQFLEMMQKPDVDQIDGLSPAISIEQKTDRRRNPRSTVGTVTEIYVLHAAAVGPRSGCPIRQPTGLPIESQIVSQMVDPGAGACRGHPALSAGAGGARPKGEYRKELANISKRASARQDRRHVHELGRTRLASTRNSRTNRRRGRPQSWCARHRPAAWRKVSRTALKLADGLAVIEYADCARRRPDEKKKTAKIHDKSGPERILFSEKFACPVVRLHHSRNRAPAVLLQQPLWRLSGLRRARRRAAYRRGSGHSRQGDDLRKGAIAPWAKVVLALLHPDADRALANFYKFTLDTKVVRICRRRRRTAILHGSGEDEIKFSYEDGVRSYDTKNRSRASSPTSTAAFARPRANGRARSWQNISPTFPAPAATATG